MHAISSLYIEMFVVFLKKKKANECLTEFFLLTEWSGDSVSFGSAALLKWNHTEKSAGWLQTATQRKTWALC